MANLKPKNLTAGNVSPSGKRIISDVVISKESILAPKREITSQYFRAPSPSIKAPKTSSFKLKTGVLLPLIIVLILLGGAVISITTAGMEVIVTPKTVSAQIERALVVAKRGGEAARDLNFSTVSLPDSRSDTFAARETRKEASRARGTIVIFNKNKEPQVLVASTRLESPDGRIYRIPSTIVIPAAKTQGETIIPGSREVVAVADGPGADYNSGLTDFTLPGLKGSARYELVFGRSKTPFEGGGSGNETIVGKADIDSARKKFVADVEREIAQLISKRLPDGEVLLRPSTEYVITKESINPPAGSPASSFDARFEGELRGAVVARSDYETALIKNHPVLASFGTGPLSFKIKNLDELKLKLSGYKFEAASFKVGVSGTAQVEASTDPDLIKDALMRDRISDASGILTAFPGLARAEVKFKPFWARWFYSKPPSNPSRIDIVLQGS